MATSAERMRVLRERERRGIRRFTISVSADDLRVIAEHGYEGAASADHDQQAQGGPQFAAFIPPYPDLADFPLSADVFTAEAVLVPLLSPLPTSELDPMLRDCAGEYRHRSG